MANLLVRRMADLVISSPPSQSSLLLASSWSSLVSKHSLSSLSSLPTILDRRRAVLAQFTSQPSVQNEKPDNDILTSPHRCYTTHIIRPPKVKLLHGGPPASPQILTLDDGRRFSVADTSRRPKLKPHIVKRRLARMKTYLGTERDIRYSPWRLNLICQLVAGLPLLEALKQLDYCTKAKAPLVKKILIRTSNLADIRDGLQMSQLEVAECFATHGHHIKGIRPMAKGRFGRTKKRFSHFRLILREIDFPLRIYQARSLNQKKRWIERKVRAEKDAAAAEAEREELVQLEQQAAEKEMKKA